MAKKYKKITEVIFDEQVDDAYFFFKPAYEKMDMDPQSIPHRQKTRFLKALEHPDLYFVEFYHKEVYYNDHEVWCKMTIERDETEEERSKRLALSRKRSEAAKKAAETRKKQKEEEERLLYETLKEKYG
jgi:hypothetical protein